MPRNTRNVLTAVKVRSLIQAGRQTAVSDGGGLTLTVSGTGYAAWVLRYSYQGKRREFTIGPEADFPLAEARRAAEGLRRRIGAGEDISKTKRRVRSQQAADNGPESFAQLAQIWFDRTQKDRLANPEVIWRVFRRWINPRIGSLCLEDIRGFHIVECLEAIKDGGAPTVMNDARRHIQKVIAYGVSLGYLQADVSAGIDHKQAGVTERPRSRALSLEEIHALLRKMEAERAWFGRDNELTVKLLLLLGVRKSELIEAKWDEFDLENGLWHLPADRSKSRRGQVVPLSDPALRCLLELHQRACGSEWVLPARRRGKRAAGHVGKDTLNAALENLDYGIEHFTVHDLRRTMRTQLSALGIRPEVAERCLNHALTGILAVYDQHDLLPERTDALNKWATLFETLDRDGTEATKKLGCSGDVIPIRSAF